MARPATGQVIERERAGGVRVFALRFRAYGKRYYVTLGSTAEGWSRPRADEELANVLADVRRGIWRPHEPEPVEPPAEIPTFHVFASEWFESRRQEGLEQSTLDAIEWRLSYVLLPFFAKHRLTEITPREVDRYRQAQVRERERLRALREVQAKLPPGERERVPRPLANSTINRTIGLLAQILEVAVEYGLIDSNPAAGRRRRLKASRPARAYLDSARQIEALLAAAGEFDAAARDDRQHVGRRAQLATLVFAGLRVSELLDLRWRDVDLAGGWLTVGKAKTDAGVRKVKIRPALRDELLEHRARAGAPQASAYVFGTSEGKRQYATNVRGRVLRPALERASAKLADEGEAPLPMLTPHGLRRSFASLLYAIGEPPPVVMQEMGHTDPALALSIYAHAMRRDEGENAHLRALVNGHEWAPAEDGSDPFDALGESAGTTEPALEAGSVEARPAGFEPATSASGGQRSIH
jgi:integrase